MTADGAVVCPSEPPPEQPEATEHPSKERREEAAEIDADDLAATIKAYNGEDEEAKDPEQDSKKTPKDSEKTSDPDSDHTDVDAAEPDEDANEQRDYTAFVSPGDNSCYWEADTMAPLNARSAAAIARLRAFRSPAFSLWDRLPLSRRAAVLVLLYADRRGDLRVVLTMRAASLRNYSGHAAFPGGKADTLDETPEQIARREAWEEIGLPMDDNVTTEGGGEKVARLPRGFWIEHLCSMPYNLAKTELVVRPCVAFLHSEKSERSGTESKTESKETKDDANGDEEKDVETTLLPRLDAKEVAAVFSAPFHNFLLATDEVSPLDRMPLALTQAGADPTRAGPLFRPKLPPGKWYEGSWIHWHEEPWRMHFFYVPVVGQRVAKPKKRRRSSDASNASNASNASTSTLTTTEIQKPKDDGHGSAINTPDEIEEMPGRYKVWGMTARILVDAASLAYGEKPEFGHNAHFGDEKVIGGLYKMGRLGEKKKANDELTHEDIKKAAKI